MATIAYLRSDAGSNSKSIEILNDNSYDVIQFKLSTSNTWCTAVYDQSISGKSRYKSSGSGCVGWDSGGGGVLIPSNIVQIKVNNGAVIEYSLSDIKTYSYSGNISAIGDISLMSLCDGTWTLLVNNFGANSNNCGNPITGVQWRIPDRGITIFQDFLAVDSSCSRSYTSPFTLTGVGSTCNVEIRYNSCYTQGGAATTVTDTLNVNPAVGCAGSTTTSTTTTSTTSTTSTTTTSPLTTTSTTSTTTTTLPIVTTTVVPSITSVGVNVGGILKGSSTNDIVFPVPSVGGSCVFTGSYKITSLASYGIILKNGQPLLINGTFSNSDVIQISTSVTDVAGAFSFSYKAIGSCGDSNASTINYIINSPVETTTVVINQIANANNQSANVLIGTRGQINLTTGDVACTSGFTSYSIKLNSIVGLTNVQLIDNIASFDVIGALGYFTKQLYCNGLLIDEAVVIITGVPNTTVVCGCTPCTNQDAQPIWQFFKQVGGVQVYKDINSCSSTYGNTESRGSCNNIVTSNCGCQ